MIPLEPKQYWLDILSSYDGDHQKVKGVILNDRASLGVVAALLLATNVSAIICVQKTILYNWQFISVLFHTISGMLSLSCVWISLQQYLKINMLTPKKAIEYKLLMRWYDEPVMSLTASIMTLPIALYATIYIAYGLQVAIYALFIILIVSTYSCFIVYKSASAYHKVNRIDQ
jgi:hypothetical protein